ncbi:MAG: PAS domain S-box protein [Bacteroidetes bacterium]|nr:PAS domain S-box protein [Bacteroidota bacterium]
MEKPTGAASVDHFNLFPSENPFPVLRVLRSGVLSFANPASQPLLDFWGRRVGERLPVEWLELISKVLRNGTRFDTEVYAGKILLYLSLIPVPSCDCVNIYGFDDTEKAVARKRLEESENLFRGAFHTSPDAVNINRLSDGLYVDINQGFTALTGYTREEVIGRTSFEINIWDNIDDRTKLIAGLKEQGIVQNLEARFRLKDGRAKMALLSAQILQINGELHILSITRDIEEIITAQEALRESEARMRSLQENLPLALYRTTPDGRIVYANTAMARMFGFDSIEDLYQVRTGDLYVDPHQREQVLSVLKKHGLVKDWEVKLFRRDGSIIDCALNVRAVFDSHGTLVNQDGIVNDITERKRIQQAVLFAKERAEEVSRIKSNFLATMSHELRTPLNGILGFASLLEEALEDEGLRDMAAVINTSGHRLLETLNSILDLSIIEADKLNVNWDDVAVTDIIAEVEVLYKANARKKGLSLRSQLPETALTIRSDERLLRQILTNLLNNAVKYTETGGITLVVETASDIHREGISIHVCDTGIGISPHDQEVIFDEFRQASEGYSRAYDGSGLGLSVSQKFAHVLGGRITLQSTPGKGSCFTLHLPHRNV